jgi:hypothetical protein
VTDLPGESDTVFLSSRRARIRVNEPFGGLTPDTKEVDVLTGSGGGDCGIPFEPGEHYLVEASVDKDGVLHAGICSFTRKVEDAGVALRILREQRDGRPVSSLAGRIVRVDRSFGGLLGTRNTKPLANTLVRVRTEARTYETESDAEGLYAFYNLPPGKYEFALDLPRGTTLGSDKPQAPFGLGPPWGLCAERNIAVFSSGSIQGRVLDSLNKPVRQAFVCIIPADEDAIPKAQHLDCAFQKEDSFKFVNIWPGRYQLVVNPDDSRDPDFPYRKTFFPGVHERVAAGVVTVREGEQVSGVDIRLEQAFAQRHLSVRVTWADGRLIRDFVSVSAKGTADPAAKSDARQLDMKVSVAELSVLPDEPYEVEAELTCVYADERSIGPGATLRSNKIYLKPGDERTELLLTIPGLGCPEIAGKRPLTDQ